ncbi:ATP-binding protein [Arcticibacter eurypsychrophilus]|uniref:ATP-binding protein n=1 Tax=Arcticibacter eurypsychrophilus TaxID=1434752 RepID=UPI00084DE434|nr:ATP-binding protein [Arcticibacter eurypsychrophilus]
MVKIKSSEEGALLIARKELAFQKEEKEKLAAELVIARKEVAFQKKEKSKRAAELGIANKELVFQDEEKEKRAAELGIANKELAFQDEEKEKRADELIIANIELAFQDEEKGKRAAELDIAIIELAFQDEEKEKRAAELIIANLELAYQDEEKEKRAAELNIANEELIFQNDEKEKRAAELGIANKELIFQNDEKEKRAAELIIANKELVFQNDEKEKRAAELIIANKELVFQNDEKEKRAAELIIANKELLFQTGEREKRAAELIIANKELVFQNGEKEKRAAELIIANKELVFQNNEKEKRAAELSIANKELVFQNEEKEKRAAELIIANKELVFQNDEKEKRAAELFIANKELLFQTGEKEKRAAELVIADIELAFQNKEKEKREIANKELEAFSYSAKLASQYSLSLIEASLDPLVTISTEGKITDMNQATVNITGITREKLTGTDFFDYFTKPQKAREVYQEVFAIGSVADFPLTLRHKDGKLTDVLFNGSVYRDDKGQVLGVVIVARDVTEQKRIATELTEAKVFAELATGIAEKAKRKAESATGIAEEAVKSKQQFLSNMSHEIRTPMNAIIGFTKVVLKTDLSIKQKEYLTAIKISGDALIVLINDILDLAKIEAGKMSFEKTPFKMAASISSMLHLFETRIQEKNIELVKEYDSNIPDVLVGDPIRLHQIILNLVSNAVKFTTDGLITVSVSRMADEDSDSVNIKFAVTDTGIGIENNKLDRIFENFQQASSNTSRLFGGTGLGLAIVKQLVEQQGGTISVESKIDKGSTFSFILRFQKTKVEAELKIGIVELDTKFKDIKILVVEDIALNQLLMKTFLDDFGFESDIAPNGKVAIEKLAEQNFSGSAKPYDIVLMDLQMPVMNGFEATEYIRNKINFTIPIIALTADVTTVDLAKCKAVGMNDYIAKPVDEQLLYSKIIEFVKKPTLNLSGMEEISAVGEPFRFPTIEHTKSVKCIDLSYLVKRTRSNSKLIVEMISIYLEQTPILIATINEGLKDKDWNLLKSAVHKLIPSFSIMGMDKNYEELAKELQECAHLSACTKAEGNEISNTLQISNLVLQLENVCLQACKELNIEHNYYVKNND